MVVGDRPAERNDTDHSSMSAGPPPPRIVAGELLEASQRLVPTVDRRRGQQPALLLQTPASQDRLEHRRLRVQQHRPVHQNQSRRARRLTRSSHPHSASQPPPDAGCHIVAPNATRPVDALTAQRESDARPAAHAAQRKAAPLTVARYSTQSNDASNATVLGLHWVANVWRRAWGWTWATPARRPTARTWR